MSKNVESTTSSQLTLFAEGSLVRMLAWREVVMDWMVYVAGYGMNSIESSEKSCPVGLSSRMFLAYLPPTVGEILPTSFMGCSILFSCCVASV